MEYLMFFVNLVTIASLFIWNRTEARTDARNANNLILQMKEENKDYHGRLCALKEKYYSNIVSELLKISKINKGE